MWVPEPGAEPIKPFPEHSVCSLEAQGGLWVWETLAQGGMIKHGCPGLAGPITKMEPEPDHESFVTKPDD